MNAVIVKQITLEGARYFGGPATSDPARQLFSYTMSPHILPEFCLHIARTVGLCNLIDASVRDAEASNVGGLRRSVVDSVESHVWLGLPVRLGESISVNLVRHMINLRSKAFTFRARCVRGISTRCRCGSPGLPISIYVRRKITAFASLRVRGIHIKINVGVDPNSAHGAMW